MKKIVIAFFLLWHMAFSQARFYLGTAPSQNISTYGPIVTMSPYWTFYSASANAQAGMRNLIPYKCGTDISVYLNSSFPDGVNNNILLRKCITPPLATQILNCTFSGQIAYRAFLGGHKGTILIRLINPDGSVALEIATVQSSNLSSGANYNNRSFSTTLTNINITAGQRILLEIGDNYVYTSGTSVNVGINRGNLPSVSDLPVDNTTTNNALNPWFEFSQTIKLQNAQLGFF